MPPAMDPGTLTTWHTLLSAWDAWFLTLALVVAVPVMGSRRFRRLQIDAGPAHSTRAKLRIYVQTIAWQWLLVAALWLVLHRHGLSLVEAGEHLGDARLTLSVTAGLAVTVGAVFLIAR